DDAVLFWECDLIGNKAAITGPAIYARDDAYITIRGATLSDNVIARGSVAFILSSYLYTDQVIFSDTRESPDLLAVQVGDDATY
ncbi:unnamed protein product, partial [Ascophyllum nodosum]